MTPKKLTALDLLHLAQSGKEYFNAEQLSGVLGTNAHTIRLLAKQAPQFLPEPLRHPIFGTSNTCDNYYARVRWPVRPVLKYLGFDVRELDGEA